MKSFIFFAILFISVASTKTNVKKLTEITTKEICVDEPQSDDLMIQPDKDQVNLNGSIIEAKIERKAVILYDGVDRDFLKYYDPKDDKLGFCDLKHD